MDSIRQAEPRDVSRLAEIEVFNNRLNYYPIFKDDFYSFSILSVPSLSEYYLKNENLVRNTFVYDDGVVKGFVRIIDSEVTKLFVEPSFQGQAIGEKLLNFAVEQYNVTFLWSLEKNVRAIRFYERHGFHVTGEKSSKKIQQSIS